MNNNQYEKLEYKDSSFPIIFHLDKQSWNNEEHSFTMHWHDSIEILYVIKGQGITRCDNTSVSSNVGNIIIVNTNQLHTVTSLSDELEYYCIIISPELFNNRDINILTSNLKNHIENDNYLESIFENIIKEFDEKKVGYKMQVKGLLYTMFTHLMRNYPQENVLLSKKDIKTLNIIKTSLLFIENNYNRQIALEEICANVNLSKYYFCRIFKETVGKSPIEYLNLVRVNRASKLLQQGKYNVSEAAELCGFNSINYFCKVFKKYKGVLPSTIKYENK
jgi:AraC-like DNA-binding protein/mannose-6-phosphate isomerase-like protein (cupin superfamily)